MFLHVLGTGYACFTMQNQHGTVVVTILRSRYTVSRCVPYLSYNLPKMQAIQHSICNEFVPLLKRPTWYQFKEADTLSHDVYHTTLLQLFNQYFFVEAFMMQLMKVKYLSTLMEKLCYSSIAYPLHISFQRGQNNCVPKGSFTPIDTQLGCSSL